MLVGSLPDDLVTLSLVGNGMTFRPISDVFSVDNWGSAGFAVVVAKHIIAQFLAGFCAINGRVHEMNASSLAPERNVCDRLRVSKTGLTELNTSELNQGAHVEGHALP